MENIKKLIKEIEITDENWKKYNCIDDVKNPQTKDLLNILISEMRELIKQERNDKLKELENDINNSQLYDDLMDFSKHTLRHYYAWKAVKELEKANKELIPALFQNIMDKFVLRLELDFKQTYSVYYVESEDDFSELLRSYDALVTYYVKRHFSRKWIIADIMEETEIDSEDAELFADLIERNYRELQLNIMIDGLSRL